MLTFVARVAATATLLLREVLPQNVPGQVHEGTLELGDGVATLDYAAVFYPLTVDGLFKTQSGARVRCGGGSGLRAVRIVQVCVRCIECIGLCAWHRIISLCALRLYLQVCAPCVWMDSGCGRVLFHPIFMAASADSVATDSGVYLHTEAGEGLLSGPTRSDLSTVSTAPPSPGTPECIAWSCAGVESLHLCSVFELAPISSIYGEISHGCGVF